MPQPEAHQLRQAAGPLGGQQGLAAPRQLCQQVRLLQCHPCTVQLGIFPLLTDGSACFLTVSQVHLLDRLLQRHPCTVQLGNLSFKSNLPKTEVQRSSLTPGNFKHQLFPFLHTGDTACFLTVSGTPGALLLGLPQQTRAVADAASQQTP